MILVDTSVWIDHLRRADDGLTAALEEGRVLGHPWVAGELALGSAGRWDDELLRLVARLPQALVADDGEVLGLIEREGLGGRGIGWVDAQLLAAALISGATELWTRDRPMAAVARELELSPA